jgi:hypothetical protein
MRQPLLPLLGLCLGLAVSGPAQGEDAQQRRNWFDDPFFQIADALPACPLPRGPFITEAERRVQAHHRAEKGTSCWLAGRCERANFHAYDQDIAAALRAALPQQSALLKDSSLWVTVQGRVVYLEGCVPEAARAAALESWARSLPQVQSAIALVLSDPRLAPPYPTAP